MTTIPIPGLDISDQAKLDQLLDQLEAKQPRNKLRADYYDARYLFKDLGISVPPKFRNFEAVLGWPAKAVDALSRRCNLNGFVIAGQTSQDLGIDVVWSDNNMDIEAPQAHDSALIHSCGFITTIKGDIPSGEPEVLMMVRDAFNATGLWNPRKRGFDAGLSVIEREGYVGEPMYMVLYLPDKVMILSRDVLGGRWKIDTRINNIGRVPMELISYRPRLGRPFGRSRISRPVMYLTDAAVRTVVRSEIGAEFFTAPQRWGLNLPEEAFVNGSGWNALLGRFLNVEPPAADEEYDPAFQPSVGQFPQMSMQPHSDQLRQWATIFASETSLPISSLGIVQDNPASAEALYASKEELVIEAEATDRVFGVGWVRAVRNALMIRDNLSEMPEEWKKLRAKWRDPSTPSKAAAADAMTKQIAAMPWMADTEVALEQFGYDRVDIERLMADKRKATAKEAMKVLRAPQPPPPPGAPESNGQQPAPQPEQQPVA